MNRFEWCKNWLSDNETTDLYEFEDVKMSVDKDGRLISKCRFSGATWVVNGFLEHMKDFADFKIETLAK